MSYRQIPILLLQAANPCSGHGNAMVTIAIPWAAGWSTTSAVAP
jgi:hypothetical protein